MAGNSLRRACALMLGLCFAGGAAYGQEQHEVFYVDNDAPEEGENGLGWDSAFNDFQEGIDAALAWVDQDENNTCEIRVAGAVGGVGGVYVPPVSTKRVWHDNRTRSFRMVNRTEMLGGYRGCDEDINEEYTCPTDPSPDTRNTEDYPTTLSGEYGGGSRVFHVFYHGGDVELDETAVLDGFIISDGEAGDVIGDEEGTEFGGAMYNHGVWNGNLEEPAAEKDDNPTIEDCIFRNNTSFLESNNDGGGAVYNHLSSPSFENCTFKKNSSQNRGGAVYNHSYHHVPETDVSFNVLVPTFRNCIFEDNKVYDNNGAAIGRGGAVYNLGGWAPSLPDDPIVGDHYWQFESCQFRSNTAGEHGGAIYNEGGVHRILDTEFAENEAWMNGGAIYENSFSQVRSCLFRLNKAGTEREGKGGGIYATAGNDGEVWIIDSQFEGCDADFGGAVAFNGTRADVVNCGFFGNKAVTLDDPLDNGAGGAAWVRTAEPYGTAGSAAPMGTAPVVVEFINTVFSGNAAELNGGAIYQEGVEGSEGEKHKLWLINSTFSRNKTTEREPDPPDPNEDWDGGGGGVYTTKAPDSPVGEYGALSVMNSVFWDNRHPCHEDEPPTCGTDETEDAQIDIAAVVEDNVPYLDQKIEVFYTCVQDDDPGAGSVPFDDAFGSNKNIDVDPDYIKPVGADESIGTLDDNNRLEEFPESPAREMGSTGWIDYIVKDKWDLDEDGITDETIPIDLDGWPRIWPENGEVDMGAYEMHCTGVADCDDEQFCNGLETCDDQVTFRCEPGTPPTCDDGVDCTVDSCDPDLNEGHGACSNTPNDGYCDDGQYCNGIETCDPVLDCQAGTPVNCDDGVVCTDDSCDEVGDACVNTANDANCDDGLFCNGAETCDALLDCQYGALVNCDDGVACTDDSCDEVGDACVNTANDANCDDGQYCNGAETCDSVLDCQPGTAIDCDDAVFCTVDSCDEVGDECINTPENELCAADADACTCDTCAASGCVYEPRGYGDVNCDSALSLFDIFCVLDLISGDPPDLPTCTPSNADIEPCDGDGAVNLFDIFAILDMIGGSDPCCGESAMGGGGMGPLSVTSIDVKMGEGVTTIISAGSQVEIRAYGDEYVDLRGFEIQVQVSGGTGGTLTLEEIYIDDQRADFAFYGQEFFEASNVEDARAVCAMSSGGVNSTEDKYLGTFVFRASQDASGTFTVSAVPGDGVTGTLAGDSAGEAMTVNIVQDASVRIQSW